MPMPERETKTVTNRQPDLAMGAIGKILRCSPGGYFQSMSGTSANTFKSPVDQKSLMVWK